MIRHRNLVSALVVCMAVGNAFAGDWPNWRGPEQTGMTREKAVVTSWSEDGKNLLWKAPVGGRTTPVVMNGRLYAITPVGDDEQMGERVICLDAVTGKVLWEHKFNVFHTDIVQVRLGWTSVVGDPETGNIYAHGTGGEFFCFNRDGKVLWKRSLGEELGRYSGYGGRLHSPIIDEDRVIISYVYILSSWGTGPKKSGHRYVAFNKLTGAMEWWGQPGVKPHDTTYSVPVVTVIDGRRLLIGGNADGNAYAMSARTGERVWSFKLAKRGINSSVVTDGKYVYVTHSEENLDTTEMGRVVCIDGSKTGDITKTGEVWRYDGLTAGYSSPAIANGRLYVIANNANMVCFDGKTGEKYWEYKLGRVMKGSPLVTADGVIYIGTVNGRFHILRDAGDHCESLDTKEFKAPDGAVVEINGSPIMSNGRVYFMTAYNTYCLGVKGHTPESVTVPSLAVETKPNAGKPTTLQILPMDVTVKPGERLAFKAKLFDSNGRVVGWPEGEWSIKGAKGTFVQPGTLVAATDNAFSAGLVTAKVGDLTAQARVRVSPVLPIHESFDDLPIGKQMPGWIGVDLRTELIEKDGSVVFHKMAKSPSAPYSRMRAFSGPPIPTGYTVQADVMATPRVGRRPVLSDMGLINSRYKLIMLGYEKAVRLVSYSPIPRIQKDVPMEWKGDVWYRAKLSVEREGNKTVVRGKVWPRGEKEPSAWTVEMIDSNGNTEGSPGLYAYSKGTRPNKPGSSVFFDNYQVERNR